MPKERLGQQETSLDVFNDVRKAEMKEYVIDGKKVGEYKIKHNLFLCYKPKKGKDSEHQTLETTKQMKAFFERRARCR